MTVYLERNFTLSVQSSSSLGASQTNKMAANEDEMSMNSSVFGVQLQGVSQ